MSVSAVANDTCDVQLHAAEEPGTSAERNCSENQKHCAAISSTNQNDLSQQEMSVPTTLSMPEQTFLESESFARRCEFWGVTVWLHL